MARQGHSGLSVKARDNIAGYLFIAPSLIGFCVFTLFGVLFSIGISFTDWSLLHDFRDANFIGIENYTSMFTNKLNWMYLRASLLNNLFLLLVVPITIFLAAIIAAIMNKAIYGKGVARAMYFMPYVTNIVAVATVWRAMYHPSKGPINMLIHRATGETHVNASLPLSAAGLLVLLSIVLTLLGGIIPSRKAARSDPVAALRSE